MTFIPRPKRLPRAGILQANNTSGVPGVRLNVRKGHRVIDVTWCRPDGSRTGTSYLCDQRPIEAMARALARREAEAGITLGISPRQAWLRVSKAAAA